jgi:transposase-like protein
MNKEIIKELMSNMDVVKELDEYGKNKLATLMEGLLIEIMGKERYEYLLENPKDKANGNYKRSLNTALGKLNLEIPRVRSGEFRSNLLPPKYQRHDESFEDLIFSLLINGDSKQEIIYKMKLRGLNFSEKAYDEIFEYIKNQFLEFKSKELQENYYFIYIDAYHCMVKDLKDKRVKKAVVYTVVGIDTNAQKSLLGYYSFFGNENKSTWMEVFQDLINRGLKRVLMFISDDFKGISEAIKAFFPYSDIQKCTVHLSRNIYKHMKKEDASYVNKKLKEIKYSCDTYDKGLAIFQSEIIDKFKNQYPTYIKYLDSKKEEFLAFLKYPETIRKLINSTNTVESVHSTFEKQRLKKGGFFQSMDILNVALFIVTDKLHKTWKINPFIKSKRYELNQIFVSKFELGVDE